MHILLISLAKTPQRMAGSVFSILALALLTGCQSGASNSPKEELTWIHESTTDSGVSIKIGYTGRPATVDQHWNLTVALTEDGQPVSDLQVGWSVGEQPKLDTNLPVYTGSAFQLTFDDSIHRYVIPDTAPLRTPLRKVLNDKSFSSNGQLPVVIQIEEGTTGVIFRETIYVEVKDP